MNKIFLQLIRFGIVGIFAALIHFSIVLGLVEKGNYAPLLANVIAFLIAFQVSYWGHRYWTFQVSHLSHGHTLTRLFLVCTGGFIANESLFYFFMSYFQFSYQFALFLVLMLLPLGTFFLSKLWVFRGVG